MYVSNRKHVSWENNNYTQNIKLDIILIMVMLMKIQISYLNIHFVNFVGNIFMMKKNLKNI